MSDEIRLTIVPRSTETQILMTEGPDDVLMARLAPVTAAHHPRAAPMLLEAMRSGTSRGSTLSFLRAPMPPGRTSVWRTGLAMGPRPCTTTSRGSTRAPPTGARLRGLGDFRDVRRQLRLVWSR